MIECFSSLFRSKKYDIVIQNNTVLNRDRLTIEEQNRQEYIIDYLAIKSDWKAIGFGFEKECEEYENSLRLELAKLRNK